MKLIFLGEDHLTTHGPQFLLHVLQTIKKYNLACRVALEVPSEDAINELLCFGDALRHTFIHEALKLYDFFAADLANLEDDATRETTMIDEIINQHEYYAPDVIVMLVGSLHLERLQKAIKQTHPHINVLCCVPRTEIISFFPSIYEHIVSVSGYFYSTTPSNLMHAEEKINQFIHAKSSLLTNTKAN